MQEVWKDLIYQGKDYGDRLEVANTGKIRNKITSNILKLNPDGNGYLGVYVSLGSRADGKRFRVHRAVAETFIPTESTTLTINHIDGNKVNNMVENLEWCTQKENNHHALKMGLRTMTSGFDNPKSKLTKDQVLFIRYNYKARHKQYGARALGRQFDIDHTTILDIINEVVYKI